MSYELTNWEDQPSRSTPLSAANLLRYNAAIDDLDSRVTELAGQTSGAFTQSVTNQSLVQLQHGLAYQPAGVICIDSQGNTVDFGAIAYPQAGICEITFGFPFTGQIFLS